MLDNKDGAVEALELALKTVKKTRIETVKNHIMENFEDYLKKNTIKILIYNENDISMEIPLYDDWDKLLNVISDGLDSVKFSFTYDGYNVTLKRAYWKWRIIISDDEDGGNKNRLKFASELPLKDIKPISDLIDYLQIRYEKVKTEFDNASDILKELTREES